MNRIGTGFTLLAFLLLSSASFAQHSDVSRSEPTIQEPIHIEFGVQHDTSFFQKLWRAQLKQPLLSTLFNRQYFSAIDSTIDSTSDSTVFDMTFGSFRKGRHRMHRSFLITEIPDVRQYRRFEPFYWMDFNRVNGYFIGLGSSEMVNLGKHDEVGVNGGFGYATSGKRWEYFLGSEYRIPLTPLNRSEQDTTNEGTVFRIPMTLALGGEFHNITSTEDQWRASRGENALYTFFAREDFRDYFKLAGWSAYLAFRPSVNRALTVEWRSDHYQSLDQKIFHGRFGGNKVLPPNPAVVEGRLNSLALTYHGETVHNEDIIVTNVFGDSVEIEQLRGRSTFLQAELGHMPSTEHGFNRYTFDIRNFQPLLAGLALDRRLRYEATTGDLLPQKREYAGGPSSLPALKNKIVEGNRMLLLNTELRLHLAMLLSFLRSSDLQLVLKNDFAYVTDVDQHAGLFAGLSDLEVGRVLYNIGIALGHISGVEIGAAWRTDISTPARFIFRFQRPF